MKDNIVAVSVVLMFITLAASWLTHVISCFIEGAWGFLIAGAIMFPVAIIHGFYLWIGYIF